MRRILGFAAFLLIMIQLSITCQPQTNDDTRSFPADLRIEALSGGLHPWEENRYVLFTADGRGKYARTIPSKVGAEPLEENEFSLQNSDLVEIWKAIVVNDFFALDPEYKNEAVAGGWFGSLTVTASGKTHRVTIQNIVMPRVIAIIRVLNNLTPDDNDLIVGE